MIKAQLFDTVELLVDLIENNVRAGARGAIVEQYDDEHFEVEFINEAGKTEELCVLSADQFIVVWQQATGSWVPIADQMAQLTAHLGEIEQREILDFGRFLHVRQQQKQPA